MENIFEIQLVGNNPESTNKFAKVSMNKKDIISQHKWYLGKDGYPFAFIKGARVPLHRYIWYLNSGSWYNIYIDSKNQLKKHYVDHINRDKLDATDNNLRLATPAENSYNKSSNKNIIDPYTNQPLHHIKLKKSGYEVSICKDNITNSINRIKTLEEAKQIYNLMATELFGEFAVLYEINEINEINENN